MFEKELKSTEEKNMSENMSHFSFAYRSRVFLHEHEHEQKQPLLIPSVKMYNDALKFHFILCFCSKVVATMAIA